MEMSLLGGLWYYDNRPDISILPDVYHNSAPILDIYDWHKASNRCKGNPLCIILWDLKLRGIIVCQSVREFYESSVIILESVLITMRCDPLLKEIVSL